jgi:nitrite reductase (NADH) small subunit
MAREWHRVGGLGELPKRGATLRAVAGHELVVITSPSGVHAIRNRCPHQGAPICGGMVTGTYLPSRPGELRYGLAGEVIRCPWHGWEFDVRSGDPLFGITSKKLVSYPVEVRGGDVFVYIAGR